MTNENIIKQLKRLIPSLQYADDVNAVKGAIQALSQEPTKEGGYCCRTCKHTRINKDGIWCEEPTCQWEQAVTNSEAQEPCDDLISRKAVVQTIEDAKNAGELTFARTIKRIMDLPSVTQKSGKWVEHPEIETSTPEYLMFYECSECGDKQCFCKSDIHKKRFCSNCGAKMQESEE